MFRSAVLVLSLAMGWGLGAPEVRAAPAELRPLDSDGAAPDFRALRPMLQAGPLILIENDAQENLRQVVGMMLVAGAPDAVMQKLRSPKIFIGEEANQGPVTHKLIGRKRQGIELGWRVGLPLMSFTGRRRLEMQGKRRLRVRGLSGHAQHLQVMWEVFPAGEGWSVIAQYRHFDAKEFGVVGRAFADFDRYSVQGMNAAVAFTTSVKRRWLVENMLGQPHFIGHLTDGVTAHPRGHAKLVDLPLESDPAQQRALLPLLRRGLVGAILPFPNRKLRQVVVIGLSPAPPEVFAGVSMQPERWKEFFPPAQVSNIRREGSAVEMDTAWDVPFIDLEFRVRSAQPSPDRIQVSVLEGDLATAAWAWRLLPRPDGAAGTLMLYHAYAAIGEASWFARQFVERVPAMEHGLALSSSLVTVYHTEAEARRRHAAAQKALP